MRLSPLLLFVFPLAPGCTTVDPGPNYVVPNDTFNEDYFYCHVQPELLDAKKCGPGDPSQGDQSGSCHFNAAGGFGLQDVQPPVDCGGGDHVVDPTQTAPGTPAQGNYTDASGQMNRDYIHAQLYLRPTGHAHPRQIFATDDPVVLVIQTWASK